MNAFAQNELELIVRGLPYITRLKDDPAFAIDPPIGARFVVPGNYRTELTADGTHDISAMEKIEVELTGYEATDSYHIYQFQKV